MQFILSKQLHFQSRVYLGLKSLETIKERINSCNQKIANKKKLLLPNLSAKENATIQASINSLVAQNQFDLKKQQQYRAEVEAKKKDVAVRIICGY